MLNRLLAQRVAAPCSTSYLICLGARRGRAENLATAAGGEEAGTSSPKTAQRQGGPTAQEPSASGQQQGAPSAAPGRAPSPPKPESLSDALRKASPTGKLLDAFGSLTVTPDQLRDQVERQRNRLGEAVSAEGPVLPQLEGPESRDAANVVMQAVENCKPLMKVQATKAGTKIVYVPRPILPHQSTNFAVKWILQAAEKRRAASKAKLHECLALELLLAYQKKGSARAKRDELHKLALDNRANVKIKWW